MSLTPEFQPRFPAWWRRRRAKKTADRRREPRRHADHRSRLIDRVWLGVVTLLWLWAALSNQSRVDDIQQNRIDQTRAICTKTNDVIEGYNRGQDLLAKLVVASVPAAGDRTLPPGEKDPFKWTGIKDGPLSLTVERQIPGYPTATERLKRAQDQARQLEARRIKPRDCNSDVKAVKKAGN